MRQIFLTLKDKINAGYTSVLAFFIKRCWSAIEKPILQTFKNMLLNWHFPIFWKHMYIKLLKNGDKHNAANCRPIYVRSIIIQWSQNIIAHQQHMTLLETGPRSPISFFLIWFYFWSSGKFFSSWRNLHRLL